MLIVSCSKKPESPTTPAKLLGPGELNGNTVLEEVKSFINVGPRHSGSEGNLKAVTYISNRLDSIGIKPVIDEFTDETPDKDCVFRNITGIVTGLSSRTILLVSHYDTKSGISKKFIGANDSGSSTALLLSLAEIIKKAQPLKASFMFAFLDGEECKKNYSSIDGLHGSRRLAESLAEKRIDRKIAAVIVLDMIGDKNLSVSIPRESTPNLAALVFKSAREESARHMFSLTEQKRDIIDDHIPFLNKNMPTINLIDFNYGSDPGLNNYWHTTEDTIDKLSADSLQIVGRVTIRTINKLILEM